MLSLLYENKRYSDVFELYKEIRKRIDLRGLFPDITINCLAFAACYHLVSDLVEIRKRTFNNFKLIAEYTRAF